MAMLLGELRHPLRVMRTRRPQEPDFLLFRRLPQQGLFLDIGAHAGQSSAAFHLLQPRWRILAFEPDPAMRPCLMVMKALLGRCFRFRMQGVGSTSGSARLLRPSVGRERLQGEATFDRLSIEQHPPTTERLTRLAKGRPLRWEAIERPVVTLDELSLAPTAVKLDVQGGEWQAIQGMRGTLERHRPLILMENNRHSRRIAEELAPLGYRPRNYDAARDRLVRKDNPFEALNLVLQPSA